MKRFLLIFAACFAAAALWGAEGKSPKYVFLFIGDGMSMPQRMVGEEFARTTSEAGLAINHMPMQATTRTRSANALVTDSAASGTAIACGEKTDNGRLGMDSSGKRALESVAEVAKKHGKKVGIVTSVTINHATPGAFYAHRPSRGQSYEICLDLLASGFDFFGGGGADRPNDKKCAAYKGDFYELAAQAGYKVVRDGKGLKELKPSDGKAMAFGATGCLPYAIDAHLSPEIPALCDYTAKAIEMLDNPNGFFLMVEGGSIDWAGHGNDAATNLKEVLGLDRAVQVAMAFAEKHPDETLIVVTGDHETGGMSMGFAAAGYAIYVDLLDHQKCSIGKFGNILAKAKKQNPDFEFDDALQLIKEYFGMAPDAEGRMKLSEKEVEQLRNAYAANTLPLAAKQLLTGKAGLSWTTGSHTAMPVLTTSQGCGAENFNGFIDNTDIAKKLKALLQ